MTQKVLYIISSLKKTGPVNVLLNIVKNLDRKNFEPIILTLSKEPKDSIKYEFEKLNINCYCLNISGFKGYIESIKIRNIVKKINPDIIHSHCFRSTLFTALHLNKYKTITTIHCDYDVDFKMSYGKLIGFLMAKLINFSLLRINKRIACSEYLAQILNNKKSFDVDYVNNGIDIEKFHPIENKEELRKKLKLPIDKKIFIWVGCLSERKNPLFLAKIIKEYNLKDDFFIFCGDGYLKLALENIASNFDNILLTGNINNVQEYIQASDYYISTSLSEGLPLSVLEGMACGLPVILSNIPQHKILFKQGYEIGLPFETYNSEQLVNCIFNILKKDNSVLEKNCIDLLLQDFTAYKMSEKYSQAYEELMK